MRKNSSDLLLRKYKRVRSERKKEKKTFSDRDIKKVYTIIFYDQSPKEFHQFPDDYIHYSKQKTDTGLKLELLQEYFFIPLDIFRKILHNKGIRNELEAWKKYYEEIYTLCRNMEKVMNMFSKELQELDRNTVQYMIDEMQNEIDALKLEKDSALAEKEAVISEKDSVLAEKEAALSEKDREIAELKAQLARLSSGGN